MGKLKDKGKTTESNGGEYDQNPLYACIENVIMKSNTMYHSYALIKIYQIQKDNIV
jgi:hypothetical protein